MKFNSITFCLLIVLSLSTVASAQQATQADVQALEKRVQALEVQVSNVDTTVREMDKRLTAQIQAVQTMMVEMDKRITNTIEELDKRLTARIDVLFWAIGSLIGIVLAVIVLPQVLGYFQDKRERENFQKQFADLQQQVQQQQREIAELKSRLVTTS
jgi:VIT1/CCC1 family predicted Fe2+/Mn2+ transporter